MTPSDSALRARFCEAEQGHVFRFFDELTAEEQATLLAQLGTVDTALLEKLIEIHLTGDAVPQAPAIAPGAVIAVPTTAPQKQEEAASRRIGEEALRSGSVAALVVAGGQATRLGYDAPKGTLPIGPVTGKSLFQMHAEKVLALGRRFGRPVPFLVLVSPDNHGPTRTFFEQNSWFGLEEEDVRFFEQGMLPALDRDGRLLLAERGRIFLSPDGHGGVYRALEQAGLLRWLADRGVATVFYFQVDNPLVKVADPVFVGHHLRRGSEFSLKVVKKRDAGEKVGVFALVDGKPGIVEYSDLPAELRDAQAADGELVYAAGSIAIHAFSLGFVERLGRGAVELPYHVARKKVPYVDERGELKQPTDANGIKFESFVFDALPHAKNVTAMEVLRREEFAPVKNKSGEDSPATSMRAQSDLFLTWLEEAGFRVASADAAVEIGPLFALDREELKRRLRADVEMQARRILLD